MRGAYLISAGAPCRCGPGFCALQRGLGFIGFCAGSRAESAPDCGVCGAPHQSPAGCWLHVGAGDEEADSAWLRLLRAGLPGSVVFDWQDRQNAEGRWPSFAESVDAVIATASPRPPPPPSSPLTVEALLVALLDPAAVEGES